MVGEMGWARDWNQARHFERKVGGEEVSDALDDISVEAGEAGRILEVFGDRLKGREESGRGLSFLDGGGGGRRRVDRKGEGCNAPLCTRL